MYEKIESSRHAAAVREMAQGLVQGSALGARLDQRVSRSWIRCLSQHALDPMAPREAPRIGYRELQRRRRLLGAVFPVAQIEISNLSRSLSAAGVMLTDGDGVILHYGGDRNFEETARRSGLMEGAVWSEQEQGTNGMGTCLVARSSVLIDRHEHFLYQNTALSCCASPILDGQGGLVGVLNISGHAGLSRSPTLAVVEVAAQGIENRVLLDGYRHRLVLRFHPHRAFVASAGEGILALDGEGAVLGANRAALGLLGFDAHEALIGRALTDVSGIDFLELLQLGRQPGAQAQKLRSGGQGFHAMVQCPVAMDMPSAGDVLAQAEREALRAMLERCGWNVSRAAIELHISRKTLHRKIQRHGLQRRQLGHN